MRIVTWNCSHGRYLHKRSRIMQLDPDVAVLQEATRTKDFPEADLWAGPEAGKGLAVVASDRCSLHRGPVDSSAPWSIVPFEVRGADNYPLLAVWTRKETGYLFGLWSAMDAYARYLQERPCVVVGDFNANASFASGDSFLAVARRLEDEFDLKSAYHSHFSTPFGAETSATHYFRWNVSKPFHIDYCFVPANWVIRSVEVGSADDWLSTSDHCPLIVDIADPPTP